MLREPFPDRLEAVHGPPPLRLLLDLAIGARVDVPGQKLAGLVPPPTGEIQRNLGIVPHGIPLLLAGEAVLEGPSLGDVRRDFEIQASAAAELAGLVAELGLADEGIGHTYVGVPVQSDENPFRNSAPQIFGCSWYGSRFRWSRKIPPK